MAKVITVNDYLLGRYDDRLFSLENEMTYNYGAALRYGGQRQPIWGRESEMTKNAAGGYAFKVDLQTQLERFLVLGTEKGTYYTGPQKLTKANATIVMKAWSEDPKGTAETIARISDGGLAPKNDPAVFALALGATHQDQKVREAAYGIFRTVIRIPTHLFQFCEWANGIVPLGSTRFRKAVSSWYNERGQANLAQMVVKYQQRDGWSNKDVLRLAHVKPGDIHKATFDWIFGKFATETAGDHYKLPLIISAFELAKKYENNPKKLALYIRDYGLTREMVPTQGLNSPEVWAALLEKMPLTALIRNLGNLSKCGLLTPLSDAERTVIQKLSSKEDLKSARVHPMALYLASMTYGQGHGDRGKGNWTPCPRVIDALEQAFYDSYGNVTPTGKKILLSIDVSGSMGSGKGSTLAQAVAQAMVFLNTEPNVHVIAVNTAVNQPNLLKRDSLATAVKKCYYGGGTDLSLPYQWAKAHKLDLDAFIMLTDNETWYGGMHPDQAFSSFAAQRNVKNINVAMTAVGYSVAAPSDPRTLQVCGFDATVPQVVSQFIA